MRGDQGRYAAILAGGAGTRFWPASRRGMPKPFIELLGGRPLIHETAARIEPVVGCEGLLYVLGEHLLPALDDSMPAGWADNRVAEPIPRNTLGAVLLAMGWVHARDPEAKLAILPADHVIPDIELYGKTMDQAFALAGEHVVTLGIVPTYPETGYGYIKSTTSEVGEVDSRGLDAALRVDRFVEKPDLKTARTFLGEGGYYWNSGMFVFSVASFLDVVAKVDPYYAQVVHEVAGLCSQPEPDSGALRRLLEPLPNMNIDKAVVEQCDNLAVIPARFAWSDVGSWDSAYDQRPDGTDNLAIGDVLVRGGSGNVVVSGKGGPLVAVRGLSDVVVVATGDAVLVAPRGEGQAVREVVEELKRTGRDELL